MNTKKYKTVIRNDHGLDVLLKKARVPAKSTGNRGKFTRQVLKRIYSDTAHKVVGS
jgi:hypothetical protein